MPEPFELLLFADRVALAPAAESAGIDAVVVDWECRGKQERQCGYDTQVNGQTVEFLHRVRWATAINVICRINRFGAWTADEIDAAVDGGADEILLPMVRTADEVSRTLDMVRGRCRFGILVETNDAVRHAAALGRFPLARAYVGLNDLSIDRGHGNIFSAVADGTVDTVRDHFTAPFGFGGLTLPDRGSPVPCHLLIAEMVRLRCSFSFLRRSFLRDVRVEDFAQATRSIRAAIAETRRCPETRTPLARAAFAELVTEWT
jgi:hypothetical protein